MRKWLHTIASLKVAVILLVLLLGGLAAGTIVGVLAGCAARAVRLAAHRRGAAGAARAAVRRTR